MTGSDKKSTSVQDDCVNKDQSKDVSTGQEEDFAKVEKVESPGKIACCMNFEPLGKARDLTSA